jgi:hypothetical protein
MMNISPNPTELVAKSPRKTDENPVPPFTTDDGRKKRCSYAAYNEGELALESLRSAKARLVDLINHISGIDIEDFRNLAKAVVAIDESIIHSDESLRAMKSYSANNSGE